MDWPDPNEFSECVKIFTLNRRWDQFDVDFPNLITMTDMKMPLKPIVQLDERFATCAKRITITKRAVRIAIYSTLKVVLILNSHQLMSFCAETILLLLYLCWII